MRQIAFGEDSSRAPPESALVYSVTDQWYAGYEQVAFATVATDFTVLSCDLLGGGSLESFRLSDPMGNLSAIVVMGDSLSQSAYPSLLAALTGRTIINLGRGSQGSRHGAARIGAIAVTMRVSGGEIDAGSNSVTHINGIALSGGLGASGANQFLSRGDSNTTDSVRGLLGSVRGTLTRTASGGPPSTSEVYTFVPDDDAYLPAKCPDDTVFVAEHPYRHLTHVIWLGSNDIGYGEVNTRFTPNLEAIIASLGHSNYLALAPLGRTNSDAVWQEGGTWWLELEDSALQLAKIARENFVPIRRLLIDQGLARGEITPTTQDNTDIGNDMIATSLKSDFIHHNGTGNAVVAEIVDEELQVRDI